MHSYLEKIKDDRLPLIKYDLFDNIPFITHGFTTRLGGVSEGIFSTLNLSFTRGDDRERVLKNYSIIAESIGIGIENFVASDQTHTTNIKIVKKEDCGKGITREKDYKDIDGLMTDERGIVLFTYFADCVPLFFADVKRKVVAVSHSGWKGTVQKMGLKTVEKMCEVYGSRKEDIICAIGPSVCKECYEVSRDVKDAFDKNFTEAETGRMFTPKASLDDIKDNNKNSRKNNIKSTDEKYLLDLWKANEIILLQAGLLPQNIENRRICTCCNRDILFSHRGLNGKRGNLAAFIGID